MCFNSYLIAHVTKLHVNIRCGDYKLSFQFYQKRTVLLQIGKFPFISFGLLKINVYPLLKANKLSVT